MTRAVVGRLRSYVHGACPGTKKLLPPSPCSGKFYILQIKGKYMPLNRHKDFERQIHILGNVPLAIGPLNAGFSANPSKGTKRTTEKTQNQRWKVMGSSSVG